MLLFFGGALCRVVAPAPRSAPRQRGALRLDLAGAIVEQPSQPTAGQVFGGGGAPHEYRLRDSSTRSTRRRATSGSRRSRSISTSSPAAARPRSPTSARRSTGSARPASRCVAYATGYDDDGYQLAAHADEVWLDPAGRGADHRPGRHQASITRGCCDKLGVTANVYRVGAYKAAVEPFIRNDMSPEARAGAAGASTARCGRPGSRRCSRRGPRRRSPAMSPIPTAASPPPAATWRRRRSKAGLVDHVGDRTAFGRRMAEIAGTATRTCPAASARSTTTPGSTTIRRATTAAQIGIAHRRRRHRRRQRRRRARAGAETIVRALERGLSEATSRRWSLRVDSPGGSVLASERIRQAVLAAKAQGAAGRGLDGHRRRVAAAIGCRPPAT